MAVGDGVSARLRISILAGAGFVLLQLGWIIRRVRSRSTRSANRWSPSRQSRRDGGQLGTRIALVVNAHSNDRDEHNEGLPTPSPRRTFVPLRFVAHRIDALEAGG